MILPPALAALAVFPQFINYTLVPDPKNPGKMLKKPTSPRTGAVCDPHDPANRTTYEEAAAASANVGFVFTEQDPFYFVDLDNCLVGGQWSQVAQDIMQLCNGAAVEISQSGKGLHIFGMGNPPPHACKNTTLGLELYHTARFVALTGHGVVGDASFAGADLDRLVELYFPANDLELAELSDGPCDEWDGYVDDQELVNHAFKANSVAGSLGAAATLAQLWTADPEALGRTFPGDPYDASAADAALASHLAFWTGRDGERIKRLMLQTELVRDKWDRTKYLDDTIRGACGLCKSVHKRKRTEVLQSTEGDHTAASLDGITLLNPADQVEYFRGCVYVRDVHRIFVPDGCLLKPEQFKMVYGGKSFILDSEGNRTTRNPYDVFTESQVYRPAIVKKTMFRPDLPSGSVFEFEGSARVNNYVPVAVARQPGDVSRFLRHLELVLPDERDRAILLAYMAACVQHKGVKFQWTILLQGTEGNGKTLFSRCVAYAIGMQHVQSPKASEISNKFNSWVKDCVFAYVEDVYLPESKREVLEALKPIITNDWLPVEPKGVDFSTDYCIVNLMLNSNHKDAVKKTENDRRFCVFYTAQQSIGDLIRDGMQGDYFPTLYDWLKNDNGYAAVTDYLYTYAIPDELNPAMRPRAPDSSSTQEVLAQSLGAIEQEILEAIGEGRPGFSGGWVSSMALDKLLDSLRGRRSIPQNKRRDVMKSIGYDYHPGLKEGRVNSAVMPDGGKPRLYIRTGHIHSNLGSPGEIARHYQDAQTFKPDDIASKLA